MRSWNVLFQLLAFCVPQLALAEASVDASHPKCRAKTAEFAVGEKFSPEIAERARIVAGATWVEEVNRHALRLTVYEHGRLDLVVEDNGMIIDVTCG